MHSAALLRNLDVMRAGGMMVTTPNEARLRADMLLMVGPGLIEAWPDLPARLLAQANRRVIWLGSGSGVAQKGIDFIGDDPADLPVLLAALRARCAGRPVAPTTVTSAAIDALAADLKAARFGVAVWSAATLDGLSIEMLCGLVNDLNEATRFSGLPLAPRDNAAAVLQVSGWTTGFPLRTGFARGYAEHDTWRFDAARLIDSGEADCAVWISAYNTVRPTWTREVPLIALTTEADGIPAQVAITVGRPGIDHDAVDYWPATGTLAAVHASKPAGKISVADAVTEIAAALPEAPPC